MSNTRRSGTAHSKKGLRKKKLESVQRWRCARGLRVFTPAPRPCAALKLYHRQVYRFASCSKIGSTNSWPLVIRGCD